MSRNHIKNLTEGAMIAALYVIATLLLGSISSSQIQVRISESLCILPAFTISAIPGLTIGCLISNIFIGGNIWDIIFGTLATLIASIITFYIGKIKKPFGKWLLPLPSVIINAIVVPFILYFGYGIHSIGNQNNIYLVLLFTAFSVIIGQTISCYGLGMPLFFIFRKINEKKGK